MISTNAPVHFAPSPWNLEQQIAAALKKCDASVEQAKLRSEVRANDRAVRAQMAGAKARHYRRIQGA
jgi:hypothetical protein